MDEKKSMIRMAKSKRGEVQTLHQSDLVDFKTMVVKKRKNIVEGKTIKVIPFTTIVHVLIVEHTKLPPTKKSRVGLRKIIISVDVAASIKLKTRIVMKGSVVAIITLMR